MRPYPAASHGVPRHYYYRPYYSRWYCHPYYRSYYATSAVVGFGFATYGWSDGWYPPYRHGWDWYPGYYGYGYWNPGYWGPVVVAPVVQDVRYVYVPGYWDDQAYVEGWYRPEERTDGAWDWVEGYYLEDGTHVRGHWVPAGAAPEGYTWEAGFWDGESWVEGFWRPEFRPDYTWFSAYFDTDSIYHSGYWQPVEVQQGYTWVPGWFDGNAWVDGYWVRDEEFAKADVENWEPTEGWHDGWSVGEGWGDGDVIDNNAAAVDEEPSRASNKDIPLGIPVTIPDDIE